MEDVSEDNGVGVGMIAGGRPIRDSVDEQDSTLHDEEQSDPVPNAAEAALQTIDGDQPKENKLSSIPPKPASPEEEKQIIKEMEAKANLEGTKLGQTWYILAAKWWKSWKEYTSYDWFSSFDKQKSLPGPINNDPILEAGGEGKIKKSCMENYDFTIISEEMWLTLHSWYGGGPPLPRSVISSGWHSSNLMVEVRPLTLKVCKSSSLQEYITITMSKAETVGGFKIKMCQQMGLNPDDVRVWDYHAFNKYKLLEDMKQKLDAAQIIDSQPMLLEEKDENGKFPEAPKSKNTQSYSSYYNSSGPTDPGTTGLINLGNTCFMNSSLQCLSNTAPLTEFFLTDVYKADINRDNPLGMKGEIANEYAELIKELWLGTHSAIAPREFKWKLERFAPQFAGYQQHDSQELLAFLLDGLHEDLNRVKKKPYVENPEVDDRPQEEVAREAWMRHRERNDSIIVDYFQGQLRSTLVCPDCNRVSITFDPFMYLSLPLPMKTTRIVPVTLFFLDPLRKPMRFGCEVPKFGTVKDLRKNLEELAGLKPDSVVITDVYNSRFFKRFMNGENLEGIQDRDFICGYEILLPETKDSDMGYYPIIHRKEEPIHHSYHASSYTRKSLFGSPFVLSVPDASKITYKQLYDLIYLQIQRYLKVRKGKIIRTTEDLLDEEEKRDIQTSDSSDDEATIPPSSSYIDRHKYEERETESSSGTEDDKPQANQLKKKRKIQPLFVIKKVDNYGMDQTIHGDLQDDDKPLDLDEQQTIGITWTEEMADQFYDETASKDFDLHESFTRPPEKEMEDSITLDKCIDLFTTTEKLGPEDPWYCSKCKQFQQATKKFDIWSLPPVLVIHLKRFSYKNRYWREKLETLVNYPVKGLDLSSFVKGPNAADCVYDLYAVSNHYGSLGGGHYTAYGKNRLNGNWYKFDDSSVSKTEESRVVTSSAYVLFYRRRDTQQVPPPIPSAGSSKDEEEESMNVTPQPQDTLPDGESEQGGDPMDEVSLN